jgi:hypothetical protein
MLTIWNREQARSCKQNRRNDVNKTVMNVSERSQHVVLNQFLEGCVRLVSCKRDLVGWGGRWRVRPCELTGFKRHDLVPGLVQRFQLAGGCDVAME